MAPSSIPQMMPSPPPYCMPIMNRNPPTRGPNVSRSTDTRASPCALLALLLLPPSAMVAFAIVGSAVGRAVVDEPAAFAACLGFAGVSLLFMVTQELLVEAREGAEEKPLVVSWLFFGMLVTIVTSSLADQLSGDA